MNVFSITKCRPWKTEDESHFSTNPRKRLEPIKMSVMKFLCNFRKYAKIQLISSTKGCSLGTFSFSLI